MKSLLASQCHRVSPFLFVDDFHYWSLVKLLFIHYTKDTTVYHACQEKNKNYFNNFLISAKRVFMAARIAFSSVISLANSPFVFVSVIAPSDQFF